jgi:hypothetical protein
MRILPLLFLLPMMTNCRVDHRASGDVGTYGEQRIVVDVTVRVDIAGCLALPEYDRLECVRAVTESIKEISDVAEVLLCARDLEALPIGEGADTPASCRGFIASQGE